MYRNKFQLCILYFMVCVHFSHKKYINQKENSFQKKKYSKNHDLFNVFRVYHQFEMERTELYWLQKDSWFVQADLGSALLKMIGLR